MDKRPELIQNKGILMNIFITCKNDTGMNNTEKLEYRPKEDKNV